jgi:hypothetical protein
MHYIQSTAGLLKKYRLTATLVLAAVVLTVGGLAPNTASAASNCFNILAPSRDGSKPSGAVEACINTGQNSNHVTVVYPSLNYHVASGFNESPNQMRPREGWIFMYKCTSAGTGCTAISTANELGPSFNRLPNGTIFHNWYYQLTAPSKNWTSGVRYKACGAMNAYDGVSFPGEPAHTICTALL